jgi:hypothetical protein
MLNNDYAYELDIDLDIDYLKKLVLETEHPTVEGLHPHQRLVELDDYMRSLKERFPFLSAMYNIYDCRPGVDIPLHIDAARDCAFNIPITGTEDSHTIFYKLKDNEESEFLPTRVYNIIKSPVEETFRFTLTSPTLINNTVPHAVKNGNQRRVIISWSVNKNHSFSQAKELFNKAISGDVATLQ